ncbi:protein GAMETE EXPRESSED 3 [Malania oleifera]|uniref:protein GAMETE EXPRESSED 3 n=1 Tax=Malania oleifera TaxID=397392 RepID=UPI0025AE0A06|nr:protein GAMETE EXPRESSED 3 [Malania oleifera]
MFLGKAGFSSLYSLADEPIRKTSHRLSKPLVGDDGRIYACSERNFFAFESNGTISWTAHLNYTCNTGMAPVQGGKANIYLVAENRVLKINISDTGTSDSAAEVFFGPQPGQGSPGDIIGLSVSTSLSSVFINVKNRGLFAFSLCGQLLWSAGPMLYQFGYRQGCKKNATDCYFTSVPVIDLCEASVYISNTDGELYSLSVRSPHFRWVQDFGSYDKMFTITAGNNGRLYVTIPVKSLVFALDVFTGNVLWQNSIGPLSTTECAPVVDSNGWISIGSLDGFLYSLSPTGALKKFPRTARLDSVIQVNPLLDCSGYAVYVAQTEMEGKMSRTIGEYTYISAMKPRTVVFTMMVPATGSIYWSQSYAGVFSSLLSDSDLHHFVLDERILLAFAAASKTGNPLPCRTIRQKLASTCSQAKPKCLSIYTGNERAILLFLLFESAVLIILAGLVRFCFIFWRKKKIQGQNLGNFLEKRRSLQLKRKVFGRTITELEQKAAEEAVSNEVLEELSNLVREKEGIEKKLSTTYSLGRDRAGGLRSKSLLPLYDGKSRSYSIQGSKKESVTIFHTLSDTSSGETSGERETSWNFDEDKQSAVIAKDKGKAKADRAVEVGSSNDDEASEEKDEGSPSGPSSSSRGFNKPFFVEHALDEPKEMKMHVEGEVESKEDGSGSTWLKRRRTFSSAN